MRPTPAQGGGRPRQAPPPGCRVPGSGDPGSAWLCPPGSWEGRGLGSHEGERPPALTVVCAGPQQQAGPESGGLVSCEREQWEVALQGDRFSGTRCSVVGLGLEMCTALTDAGAGSGHQAPSETASWCSLPAWGGAAPVHRGSKPRGTRSVPEAQGPGPGRAQASRQVPGAPASAGLQHSSPGTGRCGWPPGAWTLKRRRPKALLGCGPRRQFPRGAWPGRSRGGAGLPPERARPPPGRHLCCSGAAIQSRSQRLGNKGNSLPGMSQ